jgi:hypothetical protein
MAGMGSGERTHEDEAVTHEDRTVRMGHRGRVWGGTDGALRGPVAGEEKRELPRRAPAPTPTQAG